MRRRPPRVPREIIDFFEADDGRGTWTIRPHSAWRKQWPLRQTLRIIRRLPVIVQIILALFALEWCVFCTFVSWLVTGALTMR